MHTVITVNAMSERSGIVTKPNHDMYFVVQEIPLRQGAMFSGISL
jgi:hypothetical protein